MLSRLPSIARRVAAARAAQRIPLIACGWRHRGCRRRCRLCRRCRCELFNATR